MAHPTCTSCGSSELYEALTGANGGYRTALARLQPDNTVESMSDDNE